MASDPFNAVGGYTVGMTAFPVINQYGNILSGYAMISNVTVTNNLTSNGSITSPQFFGTFNGDLHGNLIGNMLGNVAIVGEDNSVVFLQNGQTHTSVDFKYFENTLYANSFSGDGSQLSNIIGSNVIGEVSRANSSNTSITVTGNNQPNITSLGTLDSLTVTGTTRIGSITFYNTVFRSYTPMPNQVALSLNALAHCGVDYIIQTEDTVNHVNKISKITATHNGANLTYVEYAASGRATATYSVVLDNESINLLVTPFATNETVYRISASAITL